MTNNAQGGVVKGPALPTHEGPHVWGEIEHILRPGFGPGQVEVGGVHLRCCTKGPCFVFQGCGVCDCSEAERAEVARKAMAS